MIQQAMIIGTAFLLGAIFGAGLLYLTTIHQYRGKSPFTGDLGKVANGK